MPGIAPEVVTEQLIAVLREAVEGPPEKWSYFVDNDPDAGYLGTLDKLGAAEASRPIGGSTIAAHVHHILFSLEASTAWIRGDRSSLDWSESWRTRTVDEAAWSRMRESLRTGYLELRRAIESHAHDSEESVGGAIGAIAHAAYHLGAIRQKVLLVRISGSASTSK